MRTVYKKREIDEHDRDAVVRHVREPQYYYRIMYKKNFPTPRGCADCDREIYRRRGDATDATIVQVSR